MPVNSHTVTISSSLLCSKCVLSIEHRAWSENKPIYMFTKHQVKIHNSVYHIRMAFLREVFKVQKGIFWAIRYMAPTGKKNTGVCVASLE